MLVLAAVVVALRVTDTGGFAAGAILALTVFSLLFVYPTAFELGAAGQTPGKRWNNLRVVHDDGSPLTFRSSALRNVLRLVDLLPGLYLVGAIAIFATRTNQRLGDLAAGTLVVREPRTASIAAVETPPGEAAESSRVGRERPERRRADGAAALPRAPRLAGRACRAACSRAISRAAYGRPSGASGPISRPSSSSSWSRRCGASARSTRSGT